MPGRISSSQIFSKTQENIRSAKEKETISGEKSSSLKELIRPSMAPSEWVISANLKDDVAVRENLARNASLATHVLTASENILSQAQDLTQKIHELALSASGGDILGKNTSAKVLPEVQGLYENFIQALNTKFGNKTLLGGFKNSGPAFDQMGMYLGDAGKLEIEVEVDRGLRIPMNISGAEAILGEGIQNGINIPQAFHRLIQGLKEDNKELIRSSLDDLHGATDQLSLARTKIAGSMLEIDRAVSTHSLNNIQSKEAIARIEEADPIKVFSDLARDQTVLRAAMDTTHKLLTGSPVDVLFK